MLRPIRSTLWLCYPIDPKRHAAALASGKEDVIYGMNTRIVDDVEVHSASAGLDYPGVGPEHAKFRAVGRYEHRASPTART